MPVRPVFGKYHSTTDDVINGEKVPAAYRAYIKRYFEKLDAVP